MLDARELYSVFLWSGPCLEILPFAGISKGCRASPKIDRYLTMELLYKVDGVKLVTTAPDGTETMWSFAGPFPAATPERSARKHTAPSSINTWLRHFLPFGN
jgi:hypothetical protein